MACFVVPVAEAVVVGVAALVAKSKEKKKETQTFTYTAKDGITKTGEKISLSRKLSWLVYLLAGGSLLLAFEHLWHGEIVPWFPFLSAASNPRDAVVMLHEMGTVGVCMSVIVTLIWVGMLAFSAGLEKRARKSALKA